MTPMTNAEKQAAHRKRIAEAGGGIVTFRLTAKAKEKLLEHGRKRRTGIAETINGLLERSRP